MPRRPVLGTLAAYFGGHAAIGLGSLKIQLELDRGI